MTVVAHLSDLHLGAHDPETVARLADEVAACEPDLTVITGDSTMRARHREFRQARKLLDRLPRPLLVVAGNHDLPLLSPERLLSPYGRYRLWISPDPHPSVRLAGVTALGLQSMPRWRWKSGRVTRGQAAEVVRVLGRAPDDHLRLLVLHHPPFATGAATLAGRERLRRAAQSARVDVILAGHTHVPEIQAGHPLVVIAGTATSTRVRDVPRSWTQLRITPGAVQVRERYQAADGTWYTGRVAHAPRARVRGQHTMD